MGWSSIYYAGWDYWGLYHKVSFDPVNKLMIVSPNATELNIKVDVYSDYKEWIQLRENAGTSAIAIRSVGGDPTVAGEFAGDIYFLQNGWRLVVDPRKTAITGALFSDDFVSAYVVPDTLELFHPVKVSSIVTQVEPSLEGLNLPVPPTPIEISTAVWTDENRDTKYLEKGIWIDTELVAAGNGSQGSPYNTLTAGIDEAESKGIRTLYIEADITIDRKLKNFKIIGIGVPTIDCNGKDLNKSEFTHCKMQGSYIGEIIAQECVLLNNFELNGFFENNSLAGDLFCVSGASVLMTQNVSGVAGLGRPTISMHPTGTVQLSVRKQGGGLTVKNCNQAGDAVTVEMSEGSLTFDSSNTDGIMVARGSCKFVNEAAGAAVTNETTPRLNLEETVEGTFTLEEVIRIMTSALAGKASGLNTINPKFRDLADTKDRIAATTDASGNRSAVTLDGT